MNCRSLVISSDTRNKSPIFTKNGVDEVAFSSVANDLRYIEPRQLLDRIDEKPNMVGDGRGLPSLPFFWPGATYEGFKAVTTMLISYPFE